MSLNDGYQSGASPVSTPQSKLTADLDPNFFFQLDDWQNLSEIKKYYYLIKENGAFRNLWLADVVSQFGDW